MTYQEEVEIHEEREGPRAVTTEPEALDAKTALERVRAHIEKHKGHDRAMFSIGNMSVLVDEIDRLAATRAGDAAPVTPQAVGPTAAAKLAKAVFGVDLVSAPPQPAPQADLVDALKQAIGLLKDLDLGRSIHNSRKPDQNIDGPLWAQVSRITEMGREAIAALSAVPRQEGWRPTEVFNSTTGQRMFRQPDGSWSAVPKLEA